MAELKEELEIKRKNNSRNSGQTRKNKRVNKHHNNTFRKIDEICKNKKKWRNNDVKSTNIDDKQRRYSIWIIGAPEKGN